MGTTTGGVGWAGGVPTGGGATGIGLGETSTGSVESASGLEAGSWTIAGAVAPRPAAPTRTVSGAGSVGGTGAETTAVMAGLDRSGWTSGGGPTGATVATVFLAR